MEVIPKFFKTHRAVFALIAIFVASVQSAHTAELNSYTENGPSEFRIEIPIHNDKNLSNEEIIKNKLLSEKLIKMGRARSQGCTRCHGRSGMDTLAEASDWKGSIAEFVVTQLTAFREGRRSHVVMASVAATMSDQDIVLVAMWYQSVSK